LRVVGALLLDAPLRCLWRLRPSISMAALSDDKLTSSHARNNPIDAEQLRDTRTII
jgi:hypothetical protein